MKYDEFKNIISGNCALSGLYFFCGEEDYLKDYCIEKIRGGFSQAADFNFRIYSRLPDAASVAEFVETVPFMSDQKLLVLRKCGILSAGGESERFAEIFSDIPSFCCVILYEEGNPLRAKKPLGGLSPLAAVIKKTAVEVEFPFQDEGRLKKWLVNIAAAGGKKMPALCADYLVKTSGKSMLRLYGEMEKIMAYCHGKDAVSLEDIKTVIITPLQDRVFELIGALFSGRRAKCYECLSELRALQSPPLATLALLSNQIMNIYRARLLLSEGESRGAAVEALGGGYGAEMSVRRAQGAKEESLGKMISLCRDADYKIKKGLLGDWAALELIIAQYSVF